MKLQETFKHKIERGRDRHQYLSIWLCSININVNEELSSTNSFQILDKIEESLNLLFMNNLIVKENNLYYLSEKTKLHIQSLDPIKINGFSGNVEFIMDFLP